MLTQSQLTTLKAHIEATPAYAQWVADSVWSAIADDLNLSTSPDFIVWKTSVTLDEIMQNGFDWTQVDNTTVGKARIWEWMFANESKAINPSKLNIRAGIDEAWKGTAAMLAVRASVYAHCKRAATKLEKLFATGTGSDASPATLANGASGYVEGEISSWEVQTAMTGG